MTAAATGKLALLWRGDREARCNATPQSNRFKRVFEELATIGISAEPAVYGDEMAGEVREQLLNVDGVLVWVDPIHQGKRARRSTPVARGRFARAMPLPACVTPVAK